MLPRHVGRARNRISVALAAVAAVLLLALVVPSADAARRPTRAEGTAIKRVSLKACGSPPGGCRFARGRVSTRNGRFAWGSVGGEGFSGVLLKRPRLGSTRFRVIGTQGGGIGSCSYWRARAPRTVLRDLHVSGLLDIAAGRVGSCG
jgi:hypothetical protein